MSRKNSPKKHKNKVKTIAKLRKNAFRNYFLSMLKWGDENPEAKEMIVKIIKETHGLE